MATTTISDDFQITLPKAMCDALHLQPGQQFELIPVGNIIQMVPKASVRSLRGIARSANPTGYRDRNDGQ